MPSVTEVLDYSTPPYLAKWFKKNSEAKCDKIAKDTAECGQIVDLLIQEDIKGETYVSPPNEEAKKCLDGWEQLKKDHPEFVPSVKEMQFEVKAFGVIGHPDFLNEEPSGWGITDLKCTNGIRDKNWIQEATYARMLMLERDLPFPSFLRTIRLDRNLGTYEWVEIRDKKMIKKLMIMFDGYLEVFNSAKVIGEFFRQQNENLILGEF